LKLFTEKRILILKLLTVYENLYIREIAERTNINPAMVHSTIQLFKKMGFISEKRVKNKVTLTLKRDNIILKKIKSLLNISELQSRIAFKKLQQYGEMGVYGSFASGEDSAESDIDLWIYSNKKVDAVELKNIARDLERYFGKEVKMLILDDSKIKRLKENDPEFYYRLKLTSVGADVFG